MNDVEKVLQSTKCNNISFLINFKDLLVVLGEGMIDDPDLISASGIFDFWL